MKRIPFRILRQYFVPQHLLTRLLGRLAESRTPWIKNVLIKTFIRHFNVNMSEALIENPEDYTTFNHFFTRLLKPELRPILQAPDQLASPADGCISQIGRIEQSRLFQAKNFYFDLKHLLGGSEKLSNYFHDGHFATIYLSPKDYHRVHMPFSGTLRETIYIPGKLFSVNTETTLHVPNLFARNERLICLFDTEVGPMAVILVGAMIVGGIHTAWGKYTKTRTVLTESFNRTMVLERGAELGHFQLGSTVILLFAKNKIAWSESLKENSTVHVGESIGFASILQNAVS